MAKRRAVATIGDVLKSLDSVAVKYQKDVLTTIERNKHMNDLTDDDRALLHSQRRRCQRIAEAVLVDYLNFFAAQHGVDLAMYTRDLH